MRLRSLLFVPGDRPDRMQKALGLSADALILDLEDAVALAEKPAAREAVANFLRSAERRAKLFVRVNALEGGLLEQDLAIILDARPDALVLPKAEGGASVEALAALAPGVPIMPIATETPAAIFQLGSYAAVRHLMLGLTWGAEDLPAAIGAASSRNEDGSYTHPYEMVRSLTLFAGHAAGAAVIETVYPAFGDLEGLRRYASRARSDGFTGMMAIHPSQVSVINEAFSPTEAEIERAQAIVAAFEANPEKGVLQLDGQMIDAPHLRHARRILGLADAHFT
ncbi:MULTISPECIES: HpcH/HpaI aldolase/citrate lyase family protein [unclassified Rhizobium]|jgi:citrate lyase subunit beta/citryl-CoA lyase|uniref:HpcH/HpaI aldolase/citrate lyase family protein n=1 Tax=unclassified Rhizobium TaxID=2613769 RepID=UPI000DD8AB7E|nr:MULTISPECIES: CoA ester lyase [unclassified Rhizobium]MDM9646157.1 CoA ester lyase [Rhizobium sp. S163]